MPIDIQAIRAQFPILSQKISNHPLIYLDNAATAQKPEAVLVAMDDFYRTSNANAHRGMHVLAERATVAYENTRASVQEFLGAQYPEEIIFTKSCTEAINLVAKSWGRTNLRRGNAVVLSMLEHHSNIVPWLQLKDEIGIAVEWIDIDEDGNLKLDMLGQFLAKGNVKLVAVTAQSNVLGTRPPLQEIIEKSHVAGVLVLVDAAQAVAHEPIDVSETKNLKLKTKNSFADADFLAFSGHKLYGPTGIGVLYGKRDHLKNMPAFIGGGMMIQEVTTDRFTAADIPQKFEGGTQPIAEAVGLGAAIQWLQSLESLSTSPRNGQRLPAGQAGTVDNGQRIPWSEIMNHEKSLLLLAIKELSVIPGLTILGPLHNCPLSTVHCPLNVSGCLSFTLQGIHPHDLTEILGRRGICLRAGHHCTQPLHRRLGIDASTRVSVGIYNTEEEIQMLRPAIEDGAKKLRK